MSRVTAADITVRAADGRTLIDRLNLSLSAGQLCILAGRNGAGKTLLARCLAGIVLPDEGSIRHEGASPALVFQDTRSQVLGQTVSDDVALGPRSAGLSHDDIEQRVAEALDRTGLSEMRRRDPFTLSGGEQRRLSIAAMLAMRPTLLILDEPFSSLDFEGVKSVLSVLLELHGEGCGISVITHDLGKLAAHADRLVLLDGGRVQADGPPAAVLPGAPACGLRLPPGPVGEMTWLR
ncbi:MAG: ATP-binding cassette domain-containing protein [Spirochaetes bacterium]|nr:ATP-binding cassette domain-containing protein [Spirochaetota bacterium]